MFTFKFDFFPESLGVFRGVQSCLHGFKLFETTFMPSSDFIVFGDCQAELKLSVFFIRVNLLFVLIHYHA